jgi:hypothetical protein
MKQIFLTIPLIALLSCSGNEIYCDMEQQAIATCSGKPISSLYIEYADSQGYYYFRKRPNRKGTNSFSLIDIDTCYTITLNFVDHDIRHIPFALEPNKEYVVKHISDGDAGAGILRFKTNGQGVIVESDKTFCY